MNFSISGRSVLLSCMAACATLVCSSISQAAFYPDTLWVPVIFYDYRADGSNPNFERCNNGGRVYDEVQEKLDAMHKPVYNRNTTGCNQRLNEWYRPSGSGGVDQQAQFYFDSTLEQWRWTNMQQYQGSTGEYVSQDFDPNYDMATVVIYDSLPFIHLGINDPSRVGMYEFERSERTQQQFFWINDRGFGADHDRSSCRDNNYGFATEIQWDFEYRPGLTFEFFGDDDVFVFVNDSLVIDLGGIKGGAGDKIDLDDIPGLVPGEMYRFSFFHAERKTCGSDVQITTNIIVRVPSNLTISVDSDTIQAGTVGNAVGQIFDQQDSLLIEESNQIQWSFVPGTKFEGDSIFVGQGDSTSFTATKAHRFLHIVGKFEDPKEPGKFLADTLLVWVKPGADHQVVIEKASRTQLSAGEVLPQTYDDSVTTSPLSLISMDSAQNEVYVYAVVRDSLGNIKRLMDNGDWNSLDPGIFSASIPGSESWEVQVSRATKGTGNLEALEPGLVPDTVEIVLQAGVLIGLRVVDSLTGQVVNEIRITTDETKKLLVQGKWSDNPTEWVTQTAVWSMDPDTLRSAVQIPTGERANWTYSPRNPGQATLTVSSGSRSVDIPVIVTPAPPSTVTIDLLNSTPTAGELFKAVVRIKNTDGLVPGSYCYYPDSQALYWDILGNGSVTKDPSVSTVQDSTALNVNSNKDNGITQCFENGIDTVTFILYNAPLPPNNQHQLWVQLDGAPPQPISGKTPKFTLSPGTVDSIVIEYPNGGVVPDSVALIAPDDNLYAQAIGYDRYGNRIGPIIGVWEPGGSLHPLDDDTSQTLYYSTQNVRFDQNGCISVTARDNPNAIADKVCLTVNAPSAVVSHASTRDSTGNGYLDFVKVHFDKGVTISDDYSLNNINLFHTYDPDPRDGDPGTTYDFDITDIQSANGTDTDTLFYLSVKEINTGNIPQTDWEPTIQFKDNGTISSQEFAVKDGAGPVIWNVVFDRGNNKNLVTIAFSETLEKAPGPSMKPELVLHVWYDSTVDVDTLVSAVDFFNTTTKSNQATFTLDDDHLLTTRHFISINMDGDLFIIDDATSMNPPVVDNQRVRVDVIGIRATVQAAPNPFPPGNASMLIPGDDEKGFPFHNRATRQQTYERTIGRAGGGTLLKIDLPLPSVCSPQKGDIELEGRAVVYDITGNKVREFAYENLFPDEYYQNYEGGIKKDIAIYWDGTNDGEMAVSPGAYIMYIDLKMEAYDRCKDETTNEQIWSKGDPVKLGVRR
ncbi:MAG: fibro-slime domain-containing protein [Chitinivibrionales bacterium]|nr:fibro-slime domain-containing protein [Chitinivibrionales bacterium]